MTDLASWLLTQIADDAAAAQAAAAVVPNGEGWYRVTQEAVADPEFSRRYGRIYDHIARYDPARVLADCVAKRAIVEEWRKHEERTRWALAHELDPSHPDQRRNAVWTVLHLLAQPYADRPGFDPTWKVET